MELDQDHVDRFVEAVRTNDGFNAAALLRESGTCNLAQYMKAVNEGLTKNVYLTQTSTMYNGGAVLDLSVEIGGSNSNRSTVPLAAGIMVEKCPDK